MQGITNDAEKLLFALYKVYLDRRATGVARTQAACIGDSDKIKSSLFPNEDAEDIANLCWELRRAGYVNCYSADNIPNGVTITSDTIVAMESRFPSGVQQVLEAIAKISGIVASFI